MWSMMDLKSVRQMGSPQESDRIYIEEKAYGRLHREESSQKRCFILMGHNERGEDGYITVVESAFEVENIAFEKGIPQWNTRVWSEVFEEVKTRFEDMVILGWALDLKGKMAVVPPELDRLHCGGLVRLFRRFFPILIDHKSILFEQSVIPDAVKSLLLL